MLARLKQEVGCQSRPIHPEDIVGRRGPGGAGRKRSRPKETPRRLLKVIAQLICLIRPFERR